MIVKNLLRTFSWSWTVATPGAPSNCSVTTSYFVGSVELHPQALRDVADLHVAGDRAVAELLLEAVVGLLLGLVEHLLDLGQGLELALDGGLLGLGDGACSRSWAGAESAVQR